MYVCMNECIYVCVNECMYVCMSYIYVCMRLNMLYMFICMYLFTYVIIFCAHNCCHSPNFSLCCHTTVCSELLHALLLCILVELAHSL